MTDKPQQIGDQPIDPKLHTATDTIWDEIQRFNDKVYTQMIELGISAEEISLSHSPDYQAQSLHACGQTYSTIKIVQTKDQKYRVKYSADLRIDANETIKKTDPKIWDELPKPWLK